MPGDYSDTNRSYYEICIEGSSNSSDRVEVPFTESGSNKFYTPTLTYLGKLENNQQVRVKTSYTNNSQCESIGNYVIYYT